jgi:hypothetical protein
MEFKEFDETDLITRWTRFVTELALPATFAQAASLIVARAIVFTEAKIATL